MSETASKKSKKLNEDIELDTENIIPEESQIMDKYKINPNKESNYISDKIIELLQEKLLSQADKFNLDLIKKYDTENMFDKEILAPLEKEIENYKLSYIEKQFKTINEIIEKHNLVESLKNLSEEKLMLEELKSYDIGIDIFSFIGPLTEKIKEMKNNEKKDDGGDNDSDSESSNNEIEKALFKLLEINYYNNRTKSLEQSIKVLDEQIEELKNKNKII